MLEHAEQQVTCAVCGAESRQFVPGASEGDSPPDFDTRPADAALETWVAMCPRCGYSAEDISTAHTGTAEVVQSAEYRERLNDSRFPELARRFLCYALLIEKAHFWSDAGWIWLHAAWVCDDAGDFIASSICRNSAIDRWKRGKELGQAFADDLASEFAIVTDLYRRIGAFENATVTCSEGLDLEDVPLPIERMLRKQIVLIQRGDTSRHSMLELTSQDESSPLQ
jgi:hypothetical protein